MSTIEQRPETAAARAITHDYSKRLMVFGGRSSMDLAAMVAGKLELDLGQATLTTFANGEVYCRYEESIRGADVFIVQSTAANEREEMTPNDALLELMVMIDACHPDVEAGRAQPVHAEPAGQAAAPGLEDPDGTLAMAKGVIVRRSGEHLGADVGTGTHHEARS